MLRHTFVVQWVWKGVRKTIYRISVSYHHYIYDCAVCSEAWYVKNLTTFHSSFDRKELPFCFLFYFILKTRALCQACNWFKDNTKKKNDFSFWFHFTHLKEEKKNILKYCSTMHSGTKKNCIEIIIFLVLYNILLFFFNTWLRPQPNLILCLGFSSLMRLKYLT